MSRLQIRLAELDEYIEFACKDASCAPPPVGTGGSKPSSGKAFSRTSAHPENRRKPIPGFMLDMSDDDRAEAREILQTEHGTPGVEHVIRRAFEGDLGNGYRSVVTRLDQHIISPRGYTRNQVNVSGVILNADDRKVGEFLRTVWRDDRTLVVSHDLLELHQSARNQGLGDRFNARAMATYEAMGVDRVVLDAALTHGGYAWARQGFRIQDDGANSRHEIVKRLASGERENDDGSYDYAITHPTKQDKAELNALVKASAAGEDIQPIHLASIGEERARAAGKNTWFGKELLLGSSWPGVFYLDRANPVTAAAVELAYADLRPKWRS